MGGDRARLREIFDSAADRYNRARPRYPRLLFEDLARLAGLSEGSRILEIGPGTGQATVDLVGRGYSVLGVELGPALAAVARDSVASDPNAEIVDADFETWPLPEEPFDAVIAATAWHWLDRDVRLQKAAHALRADGALAIIHSEHVYGGTEQFWVDAQECYERWDPTTQPGLRLTPAADVEIDVSEIEGSPLFGDVKVVRYETDVSYSTDEYIDLLLTYSGHLVLAPDLRQGLLECIRFLIDSRYGGRIVKRYLTTLQVARRVPR